MCVSSRHPQLGKHSPFLKKNASTTFRALRLPPPSKHYPLFGRADSSFTRPSLLSPTAAAAASSSSRASSNAAPRDAGATTAVLASAYSLVFAFDNLTQRNLIQQSLSRKLVHILSGLLYMASWPIFRMLSYLLLRHGIFRARLTCITTKSCLDFSICDRGGVTPHDQAGNISVPVASMLLSLLTMGY